MKGKNIINIIIGGAGLIVLALVILAFVNAGASNEKTKFISNSESTTTSKFVKTNALGNIAGAESYQEARLYMKDWNYVVEPSTLKKGIPVKMTVDLKTVVGCAQDIVIKEFGVRKYVKSGDNIIEFTPTKSGTIALACSMNMFHGTFKVADELNSDVQIAQASVTSTSQAVEIPSASESQNAKQIGSCGMASGGGCSCGKKI